MYPCARFHWFQRLFCVITQARRPVLILIEGAADDAPVRGSLQARLCAVAQCGCTIHRVKPRETIGKWCFNGILWDFMEFTLW